MSGTFDIEQEIRVETRKALDRNAAEPFLLAQIEKLEQDLTRVIAELERALALIESLRKG